MSDAPITCPYCNALLPPLAGSSGSCPRCGERLPTHLVDALRDAPSAPAPSSPASQPPPAEARPSVAVVRGTVLAIMAVMLLVALGFAWTTISYRRAQDLRETAHHGKSEDSLPRSVLGGVLVVGIWATLYFIMVSVIRRRQAPARPGPRQEVWELICFVLGLMVLVPLMPTILSWLPWPGSQRPTTMNLPAPEVVTVPPIELAALGYLPPETSVVAAIDVAAAQRTAGGKELLAHFHFGATGISLADLEKWTGVPSDNVEHAVIGLKVDNRLIPPVVIVVQTRQPYDPDKVRTALQANRPVELGQRTVYSFTPAAKSKLPLDALLWCAGPRTLVVSLTRGELEKVPDRPVTEASQLPPRLRSLLKERITSGQLWLAGDVEKWDGFAILLSLFVPKDDLTTITRLRTFAFWLQIDSGVRLTGTVRCVDEPATEALAKRWERLGIPEDKKLRAEFEPMFKELTDSYRTEVKDGWLNLQAQADTVSAHKSEP